MSRPEHVKANARLVSVPPATVDEFTNYSRAAKGLNLTVSHQRLPAVTGYIELWGW